MIVKKYVNEIILIASLAFTLVGCIMFTINGHPIVAVIVMTLFAASGIAGMICQHMAMTPVITSATKPGINVKRYDLATLHLYDVPKSTYIRLYLKWANDDDPNWKTDFLAFCKKNNIGIDEEDIDKLATLV